jgi:integrase
MKAKNINGRRQNSCKCGTWLDHWVKMSGQPLPKHCSEARCMGKPELGAHVQKDSPTDTHWYIIPLCVKHSIRAEFIEIADTTAFVSTQVADTCARQLPIGNVRQEDLRETFAANALKRGPEAAQTQDWLDHAVSASTRLYAKRQQQPQKPLPFMTMY